MDKKNIDELFRDKFKTFREIPDEKVWAGIENSLDHKRKKRALPLWWQLGGVAAVLAIALVALYTSDDAVDETPKITNTQKTNASDTIQDVPDTDTRQGKKDTSQISEASEDAVANISEDKDLKNAEKYIDAKDHKKDLLGAHPNTDVADRENTDIKGQDNKDSGNKKDAINGSFEKNRIAAREANGNNMDADRILEMKNGKTNTSKDTTNGLDEGNRVADANADTDASTSKNTNASKSNIQKKTQDGIAMPEQNSNIILEEADGAIAQNAQIEKRGTVNDSITDDSKKSIFEALELQNEDEEVVEKSSSRWSAGPNVAPVYFDAMGEGSPIDPGFSPNAKSGSTNLSYGVSITYAVSKKWSVRSGIHKAEYGYNTNNVGFSPTLAASTSGRLQNIDYVGSSENLSLNGSVSDQASPESFAPEVSNLNSSRDGNVSQQFGYLEVPLELDYALVDRRFGVNLIGGISSLFLINNSVILSSGTLTTEIGEARNLNDVNLSTNIGFGVNYKFTPKVQLNIEPVFKYQLNTFSNVSGEFRPFSIGVYSGLNFKF